MNIMPCQLQKIMACGEKKAELYAPLLNDAMRDYDINSRLRVCAFMAQIGHESGRLVYTKEIASGDAYEGRRDLGNTLPGDGVKYKGRGLIQITGKDNYRAVSYALGIDFVKNPYLLELPVNASLSAAWFWASRNLNALADAENMLAITKKINGGTNGLDDRMQLYISAKKVIS